MNINKFFKDLAIQDYITLGYLYLVIIGIINIVIYYTSFDINIFDYITITDILLAPVNMLFLDYEATFKMIILIGLISYLSKYLVMGFNVLLENIAKKLNSPIPKVIVHPVIVFLIMFSYIFLKLSIDMADGVSSDVKKKTFNPTKTITFTDNSQKDVRAIATTSMYLFYVEKGEDIVTIVPLSGNVKSIKRIYYK